MTAEQRFFESILAKASPGWDVTLAPHMQPGQMDLASLNVRVYVLDTSSGWTAAGCMAVSAFDQAKALAKSNPLGAAAVCDAAGQMIATLSKADTGGDAPEVVQCLQITTAALTTTKVFELVKPRGLAGHWLYMVYRCLDASVVARPMYFNAAAPGLIDFAELAGMARHIAQQDLANANGSVARAIKKGGGALLASAFV
jgi:hypothetical protein